MNPFDCFDEIRCINRDIDGERWQAMQARFQTLGIASRVQRFRGVSTPANRRTGHALSHRHIVEEAAQNGTRSVLVIEDNVLFFDSTVAILSEAIAELAPLEWSTCHLGGCRWDGTLDAEPGCQHWFRVQGLIGTPAIAYHQRVFQSLLQTLPTDVNGMANWIKERHTINAYLSGIDHAVALCPPVAACPAHLPYEDPATRGRFTC